MRHVFLSPLKMVQSRWINITVTCINCSFVALCLALYSSLYHRKREVMMACNLYILGRAAHDWEVGQTLLYHIQVFRMWFVPLSILSPWHPSSRGHSLERHRFASRQPLAWLALSLLGYTWWTHVCHFCSFGIPLCLGGANSLLEALIPPSPSLFAFSRLHDNLWIFGLNLFCDDQPILIVLLGVGTR